MDQIPTPNGFNDLWATAIVDMRLHLQTLHNTPDMVIPDLLGVMDAVCAQYLPLVKETIRASEHLHQPTIREKVAITDDAANEIRKLADEAAKSETLRAQSVASFPCVLSARRIHAAVSTSMSKRMYLLLAELIKDALHTLTTEVPRVWKAVAARGSVSTIE